MAKFKCTNPECEKFDVPVETSLNEDGTWNCEPEVSRKCNICGGVRVFDEEASKSKNIASWFIDHMNLNSKRMYGGSSKGAIY